MTKGGSSSNKISKPWPWWILSTRSPHQLAAPVQQRPQEDPEVITWRHWCSLPCLPMQFRLDILQNVCLFTFHEFGILKNSPLRESLSSRKKKKSCTSSLSCTFLLSFKTFRLQRRSCPSPFSNVYHSKPEIMLFSAWMQTNHLSGPPWKDLICLTSQYSASVSGFQTHTWTFLLTHVSPPAHPKRYLLRLPQLRTGCQPFPFTSLKLLFCALVTTSTLSQA